MKRITVIKYNNLSAEIDIPCDDCYNYENDCCEYDDDEICEEYSGEFLIKR